MHQFGLGGDKEIKDHSEKRRDILKVITKKRIAFLRSLRHWIAQHGKSNVGYFDESGFANHTHRRHGWALCGKEVFGRISGNNRKRINLIMVQRGSDWLAPMLFDASCTHLTVATWIQKMLLPACGKTASWIWTTLWTTPPSTKSQKSQSY